MSLRALVLAFWLAVLPAMPVAAQSDDGAFVNAEGGKLWYQTCGAGPKAMVLIHDGSLHSATWTMSGRFSARTFMWCGTTAAVMAARPPQPSLIRAPTTSPP
ncbi:MAG: hypothetical protein V4559_01435 [Pseudomonadota bacterium]